MKTNVDPFFAAVDPKPLETSAGPCDLPILYQDASLLTLVYGVEPGAARACVDGRAVEPWIVAGRAWAVLCAFEYRESAIGPYGELGVGILAKARGTAPSLLGLLRDQRSVRDAALFVTNLPVTTDRARAAGMELWGFPKYTTGIETDFRKERVRVVLERELVITMDRGWSLATRSLPLVISSVSGAGRLLRTVVETDAKVHWGGARSVRVQTIGDGPTARTVKALGLDARRPLAAFCTDHLRTILPLGEDMGPVPDAGPRVVASRACEAKTSRPERPSSSAGAGA